MATYIKRILLVLIVFSGICLSSAPSAPQTQFLQLAVDDQPSFGRLILSSSLPLRSSIEKNGEYLMVRIRAEQPFRIRRSSWQSRFVDSVEWTQGADFYVINIKTLLPEFNFESSTQTDPHRLVIDILPEGVEKKSPAEDSKNGIEDTEPRPVVVQSPAQSYRTVVIDPGHGGLEVGATGPNGTLEKDVTLALSRKLKAVIERNLAYRVVLTRDRDVDTPLERRAAIANNERAFVFISIHANGYPGRTARGAETYFLNLNATDEEARRVAYLENNSSELDQAQGDEEDAIMMILWDMAQANFLRQSSQLADFIQAELNRLRGTRNRGVKQAPFKVLTGVACPAVLVEVAFISNPDEENRLISERFQNEIVGAIYQGLSNYIRQQVQE
jgi:N-acetylmuramoyl-L-alanine amidase